MVEKKVASRIRRQAAQCEVLSGTSTQPLEVLPLRNSVPKQQELAIVKRVSPKLYVIPKRRTHIANTLHSWRRVGSTTENPTASIDETESSKPREVPTACQDDMHMAEQAPMSACMESTNVSKHSITPRKPVIEESRILLTKQEGYDVSNVISQGKQGQPPDVDPSVNEKPEVQANEVMLDLINIQTHDVFNVIRKRKRGRPPDVNSNYYLGLWSTHTPLLLESVITLSRGRGYYGSGNEF
jgi:hypothetical protein